MSDKSTSSASTSKTKNESTPATTESALPSKELAESIVNRYTAYAAGGGVVPVPLVDLAVVTGVQVKMLKELCGAYGIDYNEKTAQIALSSVIGTLGVFPILHRFFTSGLKAIPGIGQLLSLASGPAAAAGVTYGVGRVFVEHFERGGNLLNVDLTKAKETFNKFYERGKKAVA